MTQIDSGATAEIQKTPITAASLLTPGTHLVDATFDEVTGEITILTDAGISMTLKPLDTNEASALISLICYKQSVVFDSAMDTEGNLLLTIPCGQKTVLYAEFCVTDMSMFGFPVN